MKNKLSRLLLLSVGIFYVSVGLCMPAFADQLPNSELQALNEYPNWVASSCSASTTTTTPTVAASSDWVTTGATVDDFSGGKMSTGLPTSYNNGMTYAELLIGGTNAGLHPNLGEILGKGSGVLPKAFSLDIRYHNKEIDDVRLIDTGSGQPGDPNYTIDIEQPAATALGFPGKANVQVRIHDPNATTTPTIASSTSSSCSCSGSTATTVSAPTAAAASGTISPQVGYGMTPSAQQKFQQILVAAGQKFSVDPNFIAAFYYAENAPTGDSTNNGDSSQPPPQTGDGKWREPAPPYGTGAPYPPPNQYSATGPFQFINSTWAIYGQSANGSGVKDVNDLADAAFAAADLLSNAGAKNTTSDAALIQAAESYNHSSTYAQSVLNTFHYLTGKGAVAVSASGGSGCTASTGAAPDCTSGGAAVTGDAKILCEAEQYKGIYYTTAGHISYNTFRQQCPVSALATAAQSSTGASPGPCGTDCSGLVSFAVDQAFSQSYLWLADTSTGKMDDQDGTGAQFWKSIPISQAQPGDIVSLPDHVEIVDHVSGSTVYTFGAHQPNVQIGPVTTSVSYWTAGAWHWTGPGSTS